ncbi:peptidase M23 [Nocardiopsis gilva YIM 90087]|uniref:Peptidase M23 n=2 Tax=Nocardiopsis gilva TaxID=280236 RepID=A0A223SDC6_9ACTN|nr:peptidase M23 [Nocardiopsis gilva YIM 90087]
MGVAGGGYLLLGGIAAGGREDPAAMEGMEGADLDQSAPVAVEHGEIRSKVVLDATVRADPAEKVKAKKGGEATRVWVSDDQTVDRGAPIVTLAVPSEEAEPPADDKDGKGDKAAEPPKTTAVTLRAPAKGKVSGLDDLENGDPVEAGSVVAEITKNSYRAVASIPPNDLYQFYDRPKEIKLKIDKGPAAEKCEFIGLGEAEEEAAADGQGTGDEGVVPPIGGGSGGGGEAGAELSCRVPSDFKVFPGVRGKMSVITGKAKNALIVPVTAVRGSAEKGEVIVVGSDGSQEVREVELGISDGTSVEVTKGLTVDDQVLDPVPLDADFDVPSEAKDPYGGGGPVEEGF